MTHVYRLLTVLLVVLISQHAFATIYQGVMHKIGDDQLICILKDRHLDKDPALQQRLNQLAQDALQRDDLISLAGQFGNRVSFVTEDNYDVEARYDLNKKAPVEVVYQLVNDSTASYQQVKRLPHDQGFKINVAGSELLAFLTAHLRAAGADVINAQLHARPERAGGINMTAMRNNQLTLRGLVASGADKMHAAYYKKIGDELDKHDASLDLLLKLVNEEGLRLMSDKTIARNLQGSKLTRDNSMIADLENALGQTKFANQVWMVTLFNAKQFDMYAIYIADKKLKKGFKMVVIIAGGQHGDEIGAELTTMGYPEIYRFPESTVRAQELPGQINPLDIERFFDQFFKGQPRYKAILGNSGMFRLTPGMRTELNAQSHSNQNELNALIRSFENPARRAPIALPPMLLNRVPKLQAQLLRERARY